MQDDALLQIVASFLLWIASIWVLGFDLWTTTYRAIATHLVNITFFSCLQPFEFLSFAWRILYYRIFSTSEPMLTIIPMIGLFLFFYQWLESGFAIERWSRGMLFMIILCLLQPILFLFDIWQLALSCAGVANIYAIDSYWLWQLQGCLIASLLQLRQTGSSSEARYDSGQVPISDPLTPFDVYIAPCRPLFLPLGGDSSPVNPRAASTLQPSSLSSRRTPPPKQEPPSQQNSASAGKGLAPKKPIISSEAIQRYRARHRPFGTNQSTSTIKLPWQARATSQPEAFSSLLSGRSFANLFLRPRPLSSFLPPRQNGSSAPSSGADNAQTAETNATSAATQPTPEQNDSSTPSSGPDNGRNAEARTNPPANTFPPAPFVTDDNDSVPDDFHFDSSDDGVGSRRLSSSSNERNTHDSSPPTSTGSLVVETSDSSDGSRRFSSSSNERNTRDSSPPTSTGSMVVETSSSVRGGVADRARRGAVVDENFAETHGRSGRRVSFLNQELDGSNQSQRSLTFSTGTTDSAAPSIGEPSGSQPEQTAHQKLEVLESCLQAWERDFMEAHRTTNVSLLRRKYIYQSALSRLDQHIIKRLHAIRSQGEASVTECRTRLLLRANRLASRLANLEAAGNEPQPICRDSFDLFSANGNVLHGLERIIHRLDVLNASRPQDITGPELFFPMQCRAISDAIRSVYRYISELCTVFDNDLTNRLHPEFLYLATLMIQRIREGVHTLQNSCGSIESIAPLVLPLDAAEDDIIDTSRKIRELNIRIKRFKRYQDARAQGRSNVPDGVFLESL